MIPSIVWSPSYEVDIGPHVFITAKYRRVRERLLAEGVVGGEHFLEPEPATWEQLGRVHAADYMRKIHEGSLSRAEIVQMEIPFSPEIVRTMRLMCGGTLLAGRRALDDGVAVHLGGGFHHAFADHGEGFCMLNDVAVAAATLLDEGAVRQISVVDLDLHQGNGTASLFALEPRVFTFSMHQEHNYPLVKPPSDLDVGLPDRAGDEVYMRLLRQYLPEALDGRRPDLVFYLAGADPYRGDQLGALRLSRNGLRTRDRTVLEACRARGIPVAVTLAGGYAMHLSDTVEIHYATVCEAVRAAREDTVEKDAAGGAHGAAGAPPRSGEPELH